MNPQFIQDSTLFVKLILSSIGTAISVVVFIYSTFQTKASAEDHLKIRDSDAAHLEKRLDRIENKLDHILEKRQ